VQIVGRFPIRMKTFSSSRGWSGDSYLSCSRRGHARALAGGAKRIPPHVQALCPGRIEGDALPSGAAAVRELLKRGLATQGRPVGGAKPKDQDVVEGDKEIKTSHPPAWKKIAELVRPPTPFRRPRTVVGP